MKNNIWILALMVVIAIFTACENKSNEIDEMIANKELNLLDSKGLRDLLVLEQGEERFYLLKGTISEDKQVAYLHIKEDVQAPSNIHPTPLVINISLPDVWNNKINQKEYVSIIVDSKKVYFGKDKNGSLVISGTWDNIPQSSYWEERSIYKNKPFLFKQNLDVALNEIDFIKATFSKTKNIKIASEDRSIVYNETLKKPIITQNIANKDTLNIAILGEKLDIQGLRDMLNAKANENFKDYSKNDGFEYNTEIIEDYNIDYMDDRIIAFSKSTYTYLGGAHGTHSNVMEAYSMDGAKLSNKITDLFNINEQNKAQFLEILSPYVMLQKDNIFPDSLPLKVLPSIFFIAPSGIIFTWGVYEIAPYAAGDINILVPYSNLKQWVNPNSPFLYLFK